MSANNTKEFQSEADINQYIGQVLIASGHCLCQFNQYGYLTDVTDSIAKLLGYSLAEMVSSHFVDFIIEKERAAFLKLVKRQQLFLNYPITFLDKNDTFVNFKMSALPIIHADNQFSGYHCICINITEYKQTENRLRQSENNLANAQRISHLGSWELDLVTNELCWSDEIYRILGKKPQSLKANYNDFIKVIHPEDLTMVTDEMNAAMTDKTYDVQHRIIQDNGEIGILHERGEVIFNNKNKPVRLIGTTQNITALKEAEQKIIQLVNYDFLTDLPNRTMFSKQMDHILTLAKQNKQLCALFCIGLDRFKLINESMGHEAGNELLKVVAKRLEQYLNKGELVARLGGDEFALIKFISHEDIAALLAQKLINHFALPFSIQNQEIVISLSIGITLCPLDNHNSDDLLKDAQTAMHRAKLTGGNNYQFYSLKMTEKVKIRLSLESHLRHALEHQEFLLYYQPKVSTKTGKISGAEALIRWQHPKEGLVSPLDFVSVLEDTGLIIPVGEWALQELCKQYTLWSNMGFSDLSLALNLSAKQFVDNDLCLKIQRTLEKFAHKNDFLELEVTESLLMDDLKTATETLQKLHALGIKLSIDDFGTGYSSLAYLKHLPVDTLKIDRSFVMGLPDDSQDMAIANVIIMLAKALNLKIVAEGVETKDQLDFLIEKKCDYIQGYYYSKPLPSHEFSLLLEKER
jgi:diguanylate cyclase (GGDEF)-like protein/PAS domain S-box-containing protein